MFELTQKYLHTYRDAESGETSGNPMLLQLCMKYQRVRLWWNWRKEQPGLHSFSYTMKQIVRIIFTKATF